MPAAILDMAGVNGDTAARFTQLPLGVRLRDAATFDNYYPGVNGDVVRMLREAVIAENEFIYLWGGRGSGKTHLLQAVCHLMNARARPLAFFPLGESAKFSPEILEGMEQLPLVIIDDIDGVAGQGEWERGLFHLYNRVCERNGRLIMAGSHSPAAVGIELPDLRTRLAAGLVLQLRPLNDRDKAGALRLQARGRGMVMTEEVAGYLLRRCPRDMEALFALLDVLDQASLAAQRKLTVPFVKEVLQYR